MSAADGSGTSGIPDELDTVTCLRLGEALYRFLARLNGESECDEFNFEDAGVSIDSGFIEVEREAWENTQLLVESMRANPDSAVQP